MSIRKMKTYLHIHHLDPGAEEQQVVSMLEEDGLLDKFSIVGDTVVGNSISVFLGDFSEGNINPQILNALHLISNSTLKSLAEMGLSISLRLIIDGGTAAFFNPNILRAAGSREIDIYVFNQQYV